MTESTHHLLFNQMMDILREKAGDRLDDFLLPPPVFVTLGGELLAFDVAAGRLEARFPVDERYFNPYRTLQGGVLAALIDNTLGPLSMLVAPPNVTRRLEITYSRPVTAEMPDLRVLAELVKREERRLTFRANVYAPDKVRLARATAEHWIV